MKRRIENCWQSNSRSCHAGHPCDGGSFLKVHTVKWEPAYLSTPWEKKNKSTFGITGEWLCTSGFGVSIRAVQICLHWKVHIGNRENSKNADIATMGVGISSAWTHTTASKKFGILVMGFVERILKLTVFQCDICTFRNVPLTWVRSFFEGILRFTIFGV